jgi:hypothetical protein
MNKTLKLVLSLLACAIALETGSLNVEVASSSAEVAQPEEVSVELVRPFLIDGCLSPSSPSSPIA